MTDKIYDVVPEGFYPLKYATTAPKGTMWYWNRKSLFHGEFKAVLVRILE